MKIDFRQLTNEQMEKTAPVILNYPWEEKLGYAMWLSQTYYMVNHSTRLVALAGAHAPLDRSLLHDRFVDHSKEERGHQLIAISDLKLLGFNIKDLPCLTPSATMYQVQYYWVQHRGAASFFGYTLALEALAEKFGPEIYQRVVKAHGPQTAKFLKLHSDADVGHLEEAYKVIDKLTPEEAELARENMLLSSDIYREMLIKSQEYANAFRDSEKMAA